MSSTTPTSTFQRPDLQTFANDPTGTPDASSTVTISTGNGGPGTSSSLYLYTFLVTLALLLSISAAIIARSYVLRRRLRALVAAGVLPPEALVNTPRRHGGTGGRGAVEVGRRPGMWEVWLAAEEKEKGVGMAGEDGGDEKASAPLSLASLAALRAAQPHPPTPIVQEQNRQPTRAPRRPNFSVPFFSRRDPYAPAPPAAPPTPSAPASTSPASRWRPFAPTSTGDAELRPVDHTKGEDGKAVEDMQLALLIAMPVELGHDRGAGEVPVVEIGVRVVGARVPNADVGVGKMVV